MILFFSMPNIHAFPYMQILNMMHFSYIITYSRATTQLFLGSIVSRIIFQNVFNPKQHLCNMIIFQNPIKKLLTSTIQSKLTSTRHRIQQSSYQFHHQVCWNLEAQVSSLLITRPTTKLHYQIVSINWKRFPQKSNLRP